MENKKPKLKIILAGHSNVDYLDFLKLKWELEVLDATEVTHKDVDLILFTGGADVSPSYYGENIGKHTIVNEKRDSKEFDLFHKFRRTPKLGICRGAQFLTVASGGKLIQHVDNHAIHGTHPISVTEPAFDMINEQILITSTHHQMMFPYNLSKSKFNLIAFSSKFLSPNYYNGNDNIITVDNNFLEPEIVYYKETNALAIQGHPEMNSCPESTKTICLELIDLHLVKK
tara:strand:- start:11800 stop:12486 length:687 start_codon:yes stop_codon:yes gene_type:complete